MATRSNIGIEKDDGTVDYIYCHWDGYPSHNGEILQESYTDKDQIEKMISLGSISSLDHRLEPANDNHSFDSPEKGVTVFYARDRGETLDVSNGSYNNILHNMEDYAYVFKPSDGNWYMTCAYDKKGIWRPLKDVLAEEEE